MIRQEIASANASSRYQLTPTTTHTHSGTDSPFAFQPVIAYAGIIVTCSSPSTLPTGWEFARLGTGSCQIANHLNEIDQLVWIASPIGAGGATLPVPIITVGTNTVTFPKANGVVEFDWFDANGAAAPVDATFYFVGIQVNNKKVAPQQYTVFN